MVEVLGEQSLGSEEQSQGNLISRYEIARDDIINEFANISIENNFRTDVADVVRACRSLQMITEYPEIGIQIGTRTLRMEDSDWSISDSICDVYVQGAVESDSNMDKASTKLTDEVEAISHDMLRVMSVIFKKYINNAYRWNVLPTTPVKVTPFYDFGNKKNKALVLLEFQIQLRVLDDTYL